MAVAAHLTLVMAHALDAPRLPPDPQANVFFGAGAVTDIVRNEFPLVRRLRVEHHAAAREGDRGELRPHGTTPQCRCTRIPTTLPSCGDQPHIAVVKATILHRAQSVMTFDAFPGRPHSTAHPSTRA
jgi:hypothetical protein